MKRLATYFLQGLVLLAPVVITAWVCWLVFTKVDGWLGLPWPGAGFLATIALITLVGFLASNLITRGAVALLDDLLSRLPFVRLLYTSTKDLLNAFVGEKRRFDQPVAVRIFPGGDALVFGFVTQEALGRLGMEGLVTVYCPQSYNFAGQLLAVPAGAVTRLDADSAETMAFIVSGGVTGLPKPAGPRTA
jgi:uncharacterized membrane protein